MVSSRLTDLRGKAAMVTGARPPDPITVGVAGSYLEDRAPVVGCLESRKALWAVVGNRIPANLRQLSARLVEPVTDEHRGISKDLVEVQRSEEHRSELLSLMSISYAVFCLKKDNNNKLKIK